MYTAESLYGATPQVAAVASAAPLQQGSNGDLGTGWQAMVNPRNPLVVFGVILAATAGFIGFAGAARVGPVKASGSVGKP